MSDKYQNKYRIPSARAAWHDYSGGMYFITICTAGREHYFGEISSGEMQFTQIGEFADKCVREIERLHSDVFVPIYVVMPNHIHLIVIVDPPTVETSQCGVSTGETTAGTNQTPQSGVSTGETTAGTNQTSQCGVSTGETIDKNQKMQSIANRCGRLSHIISRFKFAVTKYANKNDIFFGWQTRFHDRIIRDQDELNRIADYIENNIFNWKTDDYY